MRSSQDHACRNESYNALPNTEFHLKMMQEAMVNEFIASISPTYLTINARLALKEPYIELSTEAEKRLEFGIEALKNNHIDLAQENFAKVLEMTNNQSYVAMHNLGLAYEAKGNFGMANTLYEKCTLLVKNPSEYSELVLSLSRIRKSLENEKIAIKQIES